ncbi:MAG: radical SAM protein [Methylotetracoccus sp.]
MMRLSTADHSRDSAGLRYVYPVLSRRAGGISVGINLNPNNACNWRCIYCQVPDLTRGAAPDIDNAQLRRELTGLLDDIRDGRLLDQSATGDERPAIRDIAISGNGEPTSTDRFDEIIGIVGQAAADCGLLGRIKLVLITNGSLMRRPAVQRGLTAWAKLGGETWFKLDTATREGLTRINGARIAPATVAANLTTAARLCPTFVQTCMFRLDGRNPSTAELDAYVDFLADRLGAGVPLRGVLLYGLARPSMQADAARLSPLSEEDLQTLAERIRALGLMVRVHP